MTTTIPSWSANTIYVAGDEVAINGVIYIANWWTEGDNPATNNGVIGTGMPWTVVSSSTAGAVPSVPTNLAASSVAAGSLTLKWTASTVSGGGTVTGYKIFENGVQIATVSGTVTTYAVSGLSASTAYKFTVEAVDAAGVSAQSTAIGVTTAAGAAPSTPTSLAAGSTTATGTVLTWSEAAAPAGETITAYDIYENGKLIGTSSSTSYTVSGLTAATAYAFTVAAVDAAGASAQSTALSVTTASASSTSSSIAAWSASKIYVAGDEAQENGIIYKAQWWNEGDDPSTNSGAAGTGKVWLVVGKANTTPTVPDAPTGLSATAVSSSQVDLYWTAANVQGSGTVSAYDIYENGKLIATTSNTYYDVSGLSASTGYSFTVDAVDATGTSAKSSAVTTTTLAAGATAATSSFSPYIDMGLTSSENLASIVKASGVSAITLAFIQSSGTDQIGWAGTGTIASDSLPNGSTILSQVQAVQALGVAVTISFGGASGTDPAVEAAADGLTATQLAAEYQSVITRYGVTSLDFDIEGAAETNTAANKLRDQAIKILEANNSGLTISYTLPVLPTGLDSNGLAVVNQAVSDGVTVNVVNLMAMDYGSSVDNGGAMGTDAIDAIEATEKQLSSAGLSAKIGITPMIGVNDTSSEVFTLADAQQLANYIATDSNVVRSSMWSLGRDNGSAAGATYASATGSGLSQADYAFSAIFEKA